MKGRRERRLVAVQKTKREREGFLTFHVHSHCRVDVDKGWKGAVREKGRGEEGRREREEGRRGGGREGRRGGGKKGRKEEGEEGERGEGGKR